MNLLTLERLNQPKDNPRSLRHWGSQDPWEAAELVRRHTIGAGVTLPLARIADGLVAAVVTWNLPVLHDRLRDGQGPVLYRSVLQDRIVSGRDHLVPSPLWIEAFITVEPLPKATGTLARLAGMNRAIAAVPQPPGARVWDAFTCDYYGFTVAEVTATSAEVAIQGLREGKAPGGGIAHHRRLREEQLFDLAARMNVLPNS
jgi:hypothetical protein